MRERGGGRGDDTERRIERERGREYEREGEEGEEMVKREDERVEGIYNRRDRKGRK